MVSAAFPPLSADKASSGPSFSCLLICNFPETKQRRRVASYAAAAAV